MVIKIRLARFGNRHSPVYNIVVAHARTARGSRPLEVVGTYDPLPRTPLATADPAETDVIKRYKNIELDSSRIKYWLGIGAQPSESAGKLLAMAGLFEQKQKQSTSATRS